MSKNHRAVKIVIGTLLLIQLSACGFALKGTVPSSPEYQQFRLVTQHMDDFEHTLISVFGYRGIEVSTSDNTLPFGLVIYRQAELTRELGSGVTELRIELEFFVNNLEQNSILPLKTLLVESKVNFDPNQPDTLESTMKLIRQSLYEQLIDQMYPIIQSMANS